MKSVESNSEAEPMSLMPKPAPGEPRLTDYEILIAGAKVLRARGQLYEAQRVAWLAFKILLVRR